MQLLSRSMNTNGYDIDKKLINRKISLNFADHTIEFLHICIPYSNNFIKTIRNYVKKFHPHAIVIHSTIPPYTTEKLQRKLSIPVIYSATRGVHKRMLKDLKRYTKFYSLYDWSPNSNWARKTFEKRMKNAYVKTKKISNPLTLELAKIIVDTSYYGWLINYSQLSNIIALQHKVDYDEMWSFADEIHKFLGNRPKMYPGYIGGHCVIPNLDLINNKSLYQIKNLNNLYKKTITKHSLRN